VVGRQDADIADTLQLRDVAMATTFWLPLRCNFGCVVAKTGNEIQIRSSNLETVDCNHHNHLQI